MIVEMICKLNFLFIKILKHTQRKKKEKKENKIGTNKVLVKKYDWMIHENLFA